MRACIRLYPRNPEFPQRNGGKVGSLSSSVVGTARSPAGKAAGPHAIIVIPKSSTILRFFAFSILPASINWNVDYCQRLILFILNHIPHFPIYFPHPYFRVQRLRLLLTATLSTFMATQFERRQLVLPNCHLSCEKKRRTKTYPSSSSTKMPTRILPLNFNFYFQEYVL